LRLKLEPHNDGGGTRVQFTGAGMEMDKAHLARLDYDVEDIRMYPGNVECIIARDEERW